MGSVGIKAFHGSLFPITRVSADMASSVSRSGMFSLTGYFNPQERQSKKAAASIGSSSPLQIGQASILNKAFEIMAPTGPKKYSASCHKPHYF